MLEFRDRIKQTKSYSCVAAMDLERMETMPN